MGKKQDPSIILPSGTKTMPFLCVAVGSWVFGFLPRIALFSEYKNVHQRTLPHRCGCSWTPIPPGGHFLTGLGSKVRSSEGRPDDLVAAGFGQGCFLVRLRWSGGRGWAKAMPAGRGPCC